MNVSVVYVIASIFQCEKANCLTEFAQASNTIWNHNIIFIILTVLNHVTVDISIIGFVDSKSNCIRESKTKELPAMSHYDKL